MAWRCVCFYGIVEHMNERDGQAPRATMTVPEAGEYLGISRGSAYKAAETGEIPTIRVGKRLLVPVARLDALLAGSAAAPDRREEARSA